MGNTRTRWPKDSRQRSFRLTVHDAASTSFVRAASSWTSASATCRLVSSADPSTSRMEETDSRQLLPVGTNVTAWDLAKGRRRPFRCGLQSRPRGKETSFSDSSEERVRVRMLIDPLRMTYCPHCRSRVIHEADRSKVTCGLCGTTLDATTAAPSKRFARGVATSEQLAHEEAGASAV